MPKRRCSYDNCPILVPVGTRYCPTHARQHERDRGTPEQRGYDKAYRHARLHYKLLMAQGIRFYCKRCNKIIDPTQAWDLGHDDSRRHITGPEHVSCNRRAGQNNSVRMRERWT